MRVAKIKTGASAVASLIINTCSSMRRGLVVCSVIVAACGGETVDAPSAPAEEIEQVGEGLIANLNTIWKTGVPGITGAPLRIPVCFESRNSQADNGQWVFSDGGGSATSLFRSWVRDAVESTWQRYAEINFTGWGVCSSTTVTPGIHIFLDPPTACSCTPGAPNRCLGTNDVTDDYCTCPLDPGEGVGAFCGGTGTPVGNASNTSEGGGTVGPQGYKLFYDGTAGSGSWRRATTGRVSDEDGLRLNPNLSKHQAYFAAIHEFGHALGLWHEDQRPGQSGCSGPIQNGGTRYGAVVPTIMGGCGGGTNWRPGPNDIMAIQRIYGRRHAGAIVSRHGYCLEGTNTASPPVLWNCGREFTLTSALQSWIRQPGFQTYYLDQGTTQDLCLGYDNHPPQSGDAVKLHACNSGISGHQWDFSNIEIRGVGGQCLRYNGNNAQLTMEPCSSDADLWPVTSSYNVNQKWNVLQNKIRWKGDLTKCVAAPSSTNGSVVRAEACSSSQTQDFEFNTFGFIKNLQHAKCLDVAGPLDSSYVQGNGGPGTHVQVFTCDTGNNLNQRWNFSGPWRAAMGNPQCLDRFFGVDDVGSQPWIFSCAADPDSASPNDGPATSTHTAQQWDYYFRTQ